MWWYFYSGSASQASKTLWLLSVVLSFLSCLFSSVSIVLEVLEFFMKGTGLKINRTVGCNNVNLSHLRFHIWIFSRIFKMTLFSCLFGCCMHNYIKYTHLVLVLHFSAACDLWQTSSSIHTHCRTHVTLRHIFCKELKFASAIFGYTIRVLERK